MISMSLVDVLEKLSNSNGVTGREDAVRNLMKDYLKPYVDEIQEDKLGNLISFKKGKKGAPTVMVAAHMDEVGLMVKNVTSKGFIQFAKIGGIDDRVLLAQKVIVHTKEDGLTGIIGSKRPHIQKRKNSIKF